MSTFRQKLTASKIMENRGNIGKSMREAGYSPITAKNPLNLIRSKGWQELMDQCFPDEKIAITLGQQIQATKIVFYNKKKYSFPDNDARLRALDQSFKLKQKYKPTQIDVHSFESWTNHELETYAKTGVAPERFRDHFPSETCG